MLHSFIVFLLFCTGAISSAHSFLEFLEMFRKLRHASQVHSVWIDN